MITFDKSIDMGTKQVLFRLDDNTLTSFDSKLSEKGITKQFFFTKCVEMFVDGSLSFDSNEITNDSEVQSIKKQLADILTRLDKLENDSSVIAIDKVITQSEIEDNDSRNISNDNKLESKQVTIENEDQEQINDEGIITPENENSEVIDDSERAFIELAKKHDLNDCDDSKLKENLITFLSEYLNRDISANNISKIASRHKHYPIDAIFWEYFQAEKVKNQWQWKRIKPIFDDVRLSELLS